ncbi:MAG: hypothetical protein U5K00_11300 [Melioribacteraceae bacterium]|nr:hypothetical protein [Melioribacteraceae bacterium]
MNLDLNVNFENKQIEGKASLKIENKTQTDSIILDTYELAIEKVTLGSDEKDTEYYLGKKDSVLGKPLIIKIHPETKIVNVYYSTSDNATALQWLKPEQTADGNHPFLFTQSQAVHARSWIPCQDSPGVRFTYDAKVTVPKDLLALMSAKNPKRKNDSGVYEF